MPEEALKNEGEIENVRVVVRVRPMDKNELDSGCQNVIKVDKANRSVTVVKPTANSSEPPKVYYFDNVFGEDSTQVRALTSSYSHLPPPPTEPAE
uniref:Kinesin motor domain-containing protein n=1 Tax=Anopheles marajoara TaxID=58244 RepID=A0A2M4C4K6_9DIPT